MLEFERLLQQPNGQLPIRWRRTLLIDDVPQQLRLRMANNRTSSLEQGQGSSRAHQHWYSAGSDSPSTPGSDSPSTLSHNPPYQSRTATSPTGRTFGRTSQYQETRVTLSLDLVKSCVRPFMKALGNTPGEKLSFL